jgi:AsmA family
MKTLWRWAFRLLILLIVLVVAAVLLMDTIAREIIKYEIHERTGLEAKIGKLNIGLFNPTITAENVILYNSAEFGGSPFIEMPELYIEYDRAALRSNQLHCKLIRINLARFDVVEDKAGQLNLDAMSKHKSKSGGLSISTKKTTNGWQFLGIDTLNYTLVGQAHFSSFKLPGKNSLLNVDMREKILNQVKAWSDLDGIYTVILLRNNVPLIPPRNGNLAGGTSESDDPREYWLDRFGFRGKKKQEAAAGK